MYYRSEDVSRLTIIYSEFLQQTTVEYLAWLRYNLCQEFPLKKLSFAVEGQKLVSRVISIYFVISEDSLLQSLHL